MSKQPRFNESHIPGLADRLASHKDRRPEVVERARYRLAQARGRAGVNLACAYAEAALVALEKEAKTLAKIARENEDIKAPATPLRVATAAVGEITKPLRAAPGRSKPKAQKLRE